MPEFITGVLNNRTKVSDDVEKYIGYLREKGVAVTPPDVNSSKALFSTDGKTVSYGISVIKGSGYDASQKLVEERERNGKYTSFQNMLERQESMLNKTMIEALIMSGACDCFGHTRATLMRYYDTITSAIANDKKKKETGQLSMFDGLFGDDTSAEIEMREAEEFEKNYILEREKELLCVYMSGHPLDDYIPYYNKNYFTLGAIRELIGQSGDDADESFGDVGKEKADKFDNKVVKVAGRIADATKRVSKNGAELATGKIEDMEYNLEFVCFGQIYQANKQMLAKNAIVVMDGRLSYKEGKYSLVVSAVKPWTIQKTKPTEAEKVETENSQSTDYSKKVLLLMLSGSNFEKDRVNGVLRRYKGEDRVFCNMKGRFYEMNNTVTYCDELVSELSILLGDDKVILKDKKA